MKTYNQYLAEAASEAIYEALDNTNKRIVDAVKGYFKDAYNFPTGVRFKTTNNKTPFMAVSIADAGHTFNATDLQHMLQANGGNAETSYLRGDFIRADLNQWGEFLKQLKGAKNV